MNMSLLVTFLNNEYRIPKDILVYLDALNIADSIQENLMALFISKTNSSDVKVIEDSELHDDMRKAAELYVSKLCEEGIYSKTLDEYVFENEGYKEYSSVNQKTFSAMKSFLDEELTSFMKEVEIAEINATSAITGSGVQVYSNSFLTLAATSAMEYSTLKKQYNKANAQYKNEIDLISQKCSSEREKKQISYLYNVCYPNMSNAFTIFAYGMMDKFLKYLNEAGLFDNDTLNYINLKKSQDLLENLKMTTNKEAVLEHAFLACPFNVNVYLEAAKIGLMNNSTVLTLKALKQFDLFYSKLNNEFETVPQTDNIQTDISQIKTLVNSLCLCDGKTYEIYYKKHVNSFYTSIVNEYKQIKKYAESPKSCVKLLDDFGDELLRVSENDLYDLAVSKVKSIISQENFSALVNVCGFDTLVHIVSPEVDKYYCKEDIDKFYIDAITNNLNSILPSAKIKIEEKIRVNEENNKRKEISKIKTKKTANSLLIILLLIPLFFQFITAFIWTKNIEKEVYSFIQDNIEKTSANSASSFNDAKIEKTFNIKKIKYYDGSSGEMFIVPELELKSTSSDIWSVNAELAVTDIGEELFNDEEFNVPINIASEVYVISNAEIIQSNGESIIVEPFDDVLNGNNGNIFRTSPYFPVRFIIFYAFYVFLILWRYRKLKKNEFDLEAFKNKQSI